MKGRLVIEIFHEWHFELPLFIYHFMILLCSLFFQFGRFFINYLVDVADNLNIIIGVMK